MAYEFAYRTQEPQATTDGSGMVQHLIDAVYREDGTSDPWVVVPGQSKTFNLPQADVATVMAMADGTGPEKQAKNTAYKQLFVDNIDTQNVPITGWTDAILNQKVTTNDAAATQTAAVIEYVTVTLGKTFPVEFDL